MAAHIGEKRSPERRKGREVLTARDPWIEDLLTGLSLDPEYIAEIRRFCKQMYRDRNAWDVARRARGMFGARIDKSNVEKVLRREIAALADGGPA